jgi:hypothetical protein
MGVAFFKPTRIKLGFLVEWALFIGLMRIAVRFLTKALITHSPSSSTFSLPHGRDSPTLASRLDSQFGEFQGSMNISGCLMSTTRGMASERDVTDSSITSSGSSSSTQTSSQVTGPSKTAKKGQVSGTAMKNMRRVGCS